MGLSQDSEAYLQICWFTLLGILGTMTYPLPATYFWVDDFHNFPRPQRTYLGVRMDSWRWNIPIEKNMLETSRKLQNIKKIQHYVK